MLSPEVITINLCSQQPEQMFTNTFFPSAVKLWNSLLIDVINVNSIEEFKNLLTNY